MDVILSRGSWHQMEEFAEVERIIPSYLDRSCDENHDGIRIGRGLDIRGLHEVSHCPDGSEFFDDGGGASDLLPLEGEHRLFILIWFVRWKMAKEGVVSAVYGKKRDFPTHTTTTPE